MPISILITPRAERQVEALSRRQRNQLAAFLHHLKTQGRGPLSYRMTGDLPLARLCVRHLGDRMRVVVAFESIHRAWVLLVGDHDGTDPGADIYAELYRPAGVDVPARRRSKPPCCDGEGRPSAPDTLVESLVDRAVRLRKTRRG
jgi:hypothetical protein